MTYSGPWSRWWWICIPSSSTLAELVRELTDTPDDFAADRIRIVQQVARAGLLHRHGQLLWSSRALLRALELGIDR